MKHSTAAFAVVAALSALDPYTPPVGHTRSRRRQGNRSLSQAAQVELERKAEAKRERRKAKRRALMKRGDA